MIFYSRINIFLIYSNTATNAMNAAYVIKVEIANKSDISNVETDMLMRPVVTLAKRNKIRPLVFIASIHNDVG